jgi:hypothetical protein
MLNEWQQLIATARQNPELVQPKLARSKRLSDASQGRCDNRHTPSWLEQLKPSQANRYAVIEWDDGVSLPAHMLDFIEAHYTQSLFD